MRALIYRRFQRAGKKEDHDQGDLTILVFNVSQHHFSLTLFPNILSSNASILMNVPSICVFNPVTVTSSYSVTQNGTTHLLHLGPSLQRRLLCQHPFPHSLPLPALVHSVLPAFLKRARLQL
jgi:hypothetical protein